MLYEKCEKIIDGHSNKKVGKVKRYINIVIIFLINLVTFKLTALNTHMVKMIPKYVCTYVCISMYV